MIHFDFSGISPFDFDGDFTDNVRSGFSDFCDTYKFREGAELIEKDFPSPHRLLVAFLRKYKKHYKEGIYLIIDEYDQGANEVLATSLESFKGLTKSGGILKTFYSNIKELSSNGPIARVFITGVTSIQLDSMTSGFSIAENISTDEDFVAMFGFTETELRHLIPQIVDLKKYGKTLDEVVSRMKEWYNGYCFNAKKGETVFNSSMCLNYLKQINKTGEEPDDMLDPSVANSLDKIEAILSLGDKNLVREFVEKSLNNEAIDFGGKLETLNLNMNNGLDREKLLSALFYMGFLTFVLGNKCKLTVPNRAIGTQFFEYYFKNILQSPRYTFNAQEFGDAFKALGEGNPEPWLRLVDNRLTADSGVQLATHTNEVSFQTVLASTLWFSTNYRGQLELESRGKKSGFIDLLLKPEDNPKLASYIIELKHVKANATEVAIKRALTSAKKQAERYSVGEAVKSIPNLKRLAVVYAGVRLAAFDVS